MNRVTFAAAVALATALPLSAQNSAMPETPPTTGEPATTMSAEQQRDFDSWPPDRRSQYDAWPVDARTYFWTLDADRQRGWWLLNDDQRIRIMAMPPEQQARTWASINQQLQGTAPPPATATPGQPAAPAAAAARTATASNPAMMRWDGDPVVQPVPPPRPGDYPVCTATLRDSCRNPGGT